MTAVPGTATGGETEGPDQGRESRLVQLTVPGPYDVEGTIAYLTAHAIPGRDEIGEGGATRGPEEASGSGSMPGPTDGSFAETNPAPGIGAPRTRHAFDVPGGVAVATIEWGSFAGAGATAHLGQLELTVGLDLPTEADAPHVIADLHRVLDLDTEPTQISVHLGADTRLGPLVAARPGLRVGGARDEAEFALGVVLGQQVSLAAARTLQGRMARSFARDGAGAPAGFVAAPDPALIARTPEDRLREALGITGARAATLRALAEALASGLDLGPEGDPALARQSLADIRGIGPWTVEVIALRSLRDPDAFPSGDLILRRALGDCTARAAERQAEAWRPFRGYATQHLWTEFLSR